jgi:hypothetical protein
MLTKGRVSSTSSNRGCAPFLSSSSSCCVMAAAASATGSVVQPRDVAAAAVTAVISKRKGRQGATPCNWQLGAQLL